MAKRAIGVALATLLLCVTTGCGTVHNLSGKATPYGGVATSVEHTSHLTNPPSQFHGWFPGMTVLRIGATCCWIVDIPLSAIGDTVTLPATLLVNVSQTEKGSGQPNEGNTATGPVAPVVHTTVNRIHNDIE